MRVSTILALSLSLNACGMGDTRSSGDQAPSYAGERSSTPKRALLVIDVQKCFTKGGSLAVPNGDQVVPYINGLMDSNQYYSIVLSQDWHPQNNVSFASNHKGKKPFDVIDLNGYKQTLWPDHCVQNTPGADFHHDLQVEKADKIVQKGTHVESDSYSAFEDNHGQFKTELDGYLKAQGVVAVDIVGLALDYCVKATALDAIKNGYKVKVYLKGTKAVNVNTTDGQKAIDEMKKAGVIVVE